MISTLHIKNIGIIDDLTIDLENGFNVFTGETGAGKSLIIDAINIICGERFQKDMIRKGENFSFVELNIFNSDSNVNDENKNTIVSREIYLNGKNICKINGRLVTVSELREFMNNIINIHGQNDNQKILNNEYQIKYLDSFNMKSDFLLKYKEYYKRYVEIKNELKKNLDDDKEKQRKLDLLQYEFDEINNASLKDGEEEELKNKSKLFENCEKIREAFDISIEKTNNSIDNIGDSIKAFEKISDINKDYSSKLNDLKNIYYELEEFNRDLSSENEDAFFDEEERKEVEERLDLIFSLKRKYGNSIENILEYKNKIEKEINRINSLTEINKKLKAELNEIIKKLDYLADLIHKEREEKAIILSEKINKELKDLEMQNANFSININKCNQFNKNGKDEVHFVIQTNLGEDAKELNKIASGGEMSRIMLAIKTVFSDVDKTDVMIFDEIDTGISGIAAKRVGQKLKLIGKKHQVICITHEACIAAKGDYNYYISKITFENRTHTIIKKLNEEETIDEIARISNGDITEVSRKHALELRKTA